VARISARGIVRAVALGPVTGRNWLDTMQVLTGLAVAVITFSVMLFLAVVGVVVLPTVVLVAVPFIALLASADVFTTWQRSRIAAFSGVQIPATGGVLPRTGGSLMADLLAAARRLTTWRQIGYHLIAGPLVILAGGCATAAMWGAALVFTTRPLQELLFPDLGRNPSKTVANAVAGLVLLFIAPWVGRVAALLDAVTAKAMLGPSKAEELAMHVSTLTESRAGAVSAADTERRRIERDLHDGAQQTLVSMAMRLGLARATLENVPPDAMAVIERAHEDAKQAIKELRDLVQGLNPAILNDRGLDAALSGVAAHAPLPVRLTVDMPGGRVTPSVEAVAFFIVSETLTNVAKHAGAGEAAVSVRHADGVLTVTIADDGHGGADPSLGSGLRGLVQRAASVDGTLHIQSPPGGPTVITAELPCGS
jgi:signal transduction histidine kinase